MAYYAHYAHKLIEQKHCWSKNKAFIVAVCKLSSHALRKPLCYYDQLIEATLVCLHGNVGGV